MRDGSPDTGPAALAARSHRQWWVLLPWGVAAALLAVGVAHTWWPERSAASPTTVGRAGPPAGDDSAATTLATTDHRADRSPLPAIVEVEVLAAARRALGIHGLAGARAEDATWALDLVAGSVAVTGPGVAEVTVHATVITRRRAGWHGPTTRAVVVPLRTSPVLAVAGPARPGAAAETPDHTTPDSPTPDPTTPDPTTPDPTTPDPTTPDPTTPDPTP